MHLRSSSYAGFKYYQKAIDYFRAQYKHPLFLVTSDDPGKAQAFIIQEHKDKGDIAFVGTIDQALEGKIPKHASSVIDLAILAACDHVIVSHGTFGMWAAFLASSDNTHIMHASQIEQVAAIKAANILNFIYMDDT